MQGQFNKTKALKKNGVAHRLKEAAALQHPNQF